MIDIYGFKESASGIAVDADGNLLIAVIGETYGGIRRFDRTHGLREQGPYRPRGVPLGGLGGLA